MKKITECAICIDNIQTSCHCIFECRHKFHNDCTYLLLVSHLNISILNCPLCRSGVVLKKLKCFLISYYFINNCKQLSNKKKLLCYKIQQSVFELHFEQRKIYHNYKMYDTIKQENLLLDERIANTKKMAISVIECLL